MAIAHKAGTLRQRVGVEVQVHSRNAQGGIVEEWGLEANRWAAIEPISGREFFEASRVDSDVTHKITMRQYDGLTTSHRITYGSRTFYIEAVLNEEERDWKTVAMCRESTGAT